MADLRIEYQLLDEVRARLGALAAEFGQALRDEASYDDDDAKTLSWCRGGYSRWQWPR